MSETGSRPVRFYEVIYVVVLLALLVLSVYFMNPHRVGVLDVQRVARELGIDARVAAELKDKQDAARTRAQRLTQTFESQAADLDRKLKAASGAEKEQLAAEFKAVQESFQQSIAVVRNDVRRHEAMIFGTFRKRLQPVVDQVARKRRLDIVVEPSATVIYVRKQVDISDDVIRRARSVFTPGLPMIDPSITNRVEAAAPEGAGE
jgi:outer membrane protein